MRTNNKRMISHHKLHRANTCTTLQHTVFPEYSSPTYPPKHACKAGNVYHTTET